MKYIDNKAEDVKIAYIGGGSRGWAWGLMSDLATAGDMSGRVELYDIDFERLRNENISNFICIGPFAYDIAVRIKLANIDEDKIVNSLGNFKDYTIVGVIISESPIPTIYYNRQIDMK